jgi:hypothetical protein
MMMMMMSTKATVLLDVMSYSPVDRY